MSGPMLEAWSCPFPSNSHSLYTGHNILWCRISLCPLCVTCPSCALSHLFLFAFSLPENETQKRSLASGKHNLGTTKTLVCYLHYSLTEFNTQHCSSYPSQNQDYIVACDPINRKITESNPNEAKVCDDEVQDIMQLTYRTSFLVSDRCNICLIWGATEITTCIWSVRASHIHKLLLRVRQFVDSNVYLL